jgi:hypothetical protein
MRYLAWLFGGFGLVGLSKIVEALGDGFPQALEGASWERLTFHSMALLILLAGLACFLCAARGIYRTWSGKTLPPAGPVALTAPAGVPQAPSEFDPDAALARYLERKQEQEQGRDQSDSPPSRPRPPAGGFGRRGL